jgi:pyrroline-5-carboxylate reductase
MTNILLVGYGKMGQMIYHSINQNKKYNTFVIDPAISNLNEKKENSFFSSLNSFLTSNPQTKIDFIIFAFKPQGATEKLNEYKNLFQNATLTSILAGKDIAFFQSIFSDKRKIARIMPNLAGNYKQSTSLICVNKNINQDDEDLIKNIFNHIGTTTIIEEKYFDYAMIVASCMPAILMQILKCFEEFGVKNNFDLNYKEIFASVLAGSSSLLANNENLEEIINSVSSKGGVTESIINNLKLQNVQAIINNAAQTGLNKSNELNNKTHE